LDTPDNQRPTLKRSLTTPLLTLYGLGVTIGAGIYVLIGAAAARAGLYAPVSFLLAAGVVGFSGFSYSEMGTRYPVSAGEAVYVREGLRSPGLSVFVGLMVAISGIITAATISLGAAGYLQNLVPLPFGVLVALVIVLLGLVALWGITESILLAGLFTLIEIGGLVLVIVFAVRQTPDIVSRLDELVPTTPDAWPGILSAVLLAFFAFVGFEDMANVAEEVEDPPRSMPRAILTTLIVVTILYIAVAAAVVLAVPMETLTTSEAPLAAIFEGHGRTMALTFNVIATIATVNGILVMMIMSSRVIYGLASQGSLPSSLAFIHPVTRTPVVATVLVVALIAVGATLAPLATLAQTTSQIILGVFLLVNLALIGIKRRGEPAPEGVFEVPIWVPVIGALSCAGVLLAGFF